MFINKWQLAFLQYNTKQGQRQHCSIVCTGLFSFKISHFMSLTASLGSEAKNRIVSAIFVRPSKRKTDMAVLRNAAMTCGRLPVLACEASSPSTVSRIQWILFSIVQCSRRSLSKSFAEAVSGERLVMPYCV